MRGAVTLGLLALAAVMLVGDPRNDNVELATSVIGVVLGYWLHEAERPHYSPPPDK